MESKILKPILAVYVGLFILFLYGPFIVLGILSFQQGPEGGPQFPILSWSTYWYQHLVGLTPPSRIAPLPVGEALVRSLTLAFMTMVTATVLGVMAAQAFRKRFRGAGVVFYLIVLGIVAIVVMLKAPKGVWGLIRARFDLQLFPLSYRVRQNDKLAD